MKRIMLGVSILACLSACAPRIGGSDYNVRGVGEVSTTQRGTILSKRVVNIEANNTHLGTLGGAAAGGLLGSAIGKGGGARIATGAGILGGAVAGHFAERALTNQEGFEYQVQLDSGEVKTIAQGAEPNLGIGQRVLVISSARDRGRIIADTTAY